MELYKWIDKLKDAIYSYNLHYSDEDTKQMIAKMQSYIYDKILKKQLP